MWPLRTIIGLSGDAWPGRYLTVLPKFKSGHLHANAAPSQACGDYMNRNDEMGLKSAAPQNGSPDEFGAMPAHDLRTNPGAVDPGGVIRQSALSAR